MSGHPPEYPQGVQAVYMPFHVKLDCLWISSVDNFARCDAPTDGDRLRLLAPASGWEGGVAATGGN
jgi:hypothetical protein